MSVFGNYSRYYDLLYRDKDYRGEVEFVADLIRTHAPQAKAILELGCGTGKHAALLAEQGFSVHGVDRSETMLEEARKRGGAGVSFSQGDVRSCEVADTFDAVISLFHVVSYQEMDDDVRAMFANARRHLKPGGLFVFDVWHAPAVLAEQPEKRVKTMESDEIRVVRTATPTLHPAQALVDVHYDIAITELTRGREERLEETHRMHYLSQQEVERFAAACGFRVAHACAWMSAQPPGTDTWSVCYVLTS